MGKAIVASPSATQGIEGIGHEQARIAIEANDFINDLLNLCANEKVRGKLGANARNFVMHRYDWRNNMQLFELLI